LGLVPGMCSSGKESLTAYKIAGIRWYRLNVLLVKAMSKSIGARK
jgi:hypothetical protein